MESLHQLLTTTQSDAKSTAERLLDQHNPNTLLAVDLSKAEMAEALAQVDHIFTDADGTIVEDGHEAFTPSKKDLLTKITKLGIGVTVITGKPLAEAVPLRQTLPASVPISFICEKGAYNVHFDSNGAWREFLLSSAEQEDSVLQLREEFLAFKQKLITKYGSETLGIGWGGSGEHKSALSIDLFIGEPPVNYLSLRGAQRDAIKLKYGPLLVQVEHDIAEWAEHRRPGWRVVHVGNANTEISPGGIGKAEAIIESAEFGNARKVLLLGDSPLDKSMLSLHDTFKGKALTGLVLHRKASLPLVDLADFVTFGMANSDPILGALIAARKS